MRPWRAALKKEVCSGALLVRCYFEELKIDCAIDQLKPSLKSMSNFISFFFLCYLKSALVENGSLGGSLCLLHRDAQQHTNMPNIKN